MAAGDYRIGLDGKFYHGPSGAQASTEADNVRNVNLNLSKRTAEAVRRGKKWVAKKPVVTEATLEFEIYDIEGDAFLGAVKSALTSCKILPPQAVGESSLDRIGRVSASRLAPV